MYNVSVWWMKKGPNHYVLTTKPTGLVAVASLKEQAKAQIKPPGRFNHCLRLAQMDNLGCLHNPPPPPSKHTLDVL